MRKTARLLLKRRWLSASVTTVVALTAVLVLPLPYLFLSGHFALTVSILLSLLVTTPLLIGYKRWCAGLEFDNKPRFRDMFYFFTSPKRYLKSLFTATVLFLRTTLVALASMLPTASCIVLANRLKAQPQNDVIGIFIKNLLFLGVAAAVIFSVLFVLSTVKTVATTYFVAVDDSVSVFKAMKMSSALIRQRGGYVLRTFLFLVLPSLFVLPIFITAPYFVTFFVQCAKSHFKQ